MNARLGGSVRRNVRAQPSMPSPHFSDMSNSTLPRTRTVCDSGSAPPLRNTTGANMGLVHSMAKVSKEEYIFLRQQHHHYHPGGMVLTRVGGGGEGGGAILSARMSVNACGAFCDASQCARAWTSLRDLVDHRCVPASNDARVLLLVARSRREDRPVS